MTDITIEDLITYIKSEGTAGAEGIYTLSGWLTPQIAQVLLEHNPHNRNMSKHRSKTMSETIQEGRWKANGSTITITDSSTLGDGQHRCDAVLTTGVSIPTIFVYGVADDVDVLATIDQPRVRTVHDIIKLSRVDNPPDGPVVVVTNMMMSMIEGVEFKFTDRPQRAEFAISYAEQVAPWAIWAQQISRESSTIVGNRGRGGGLRSIGSTALAGLAWHMVDQGADPDTVQEFYQGVVNPWALSAEAIREMTENRKVLLEALNRHCRHQPLNRFNGGNATNQLLTQYAVHIIAYNRYLLNEQVLMIRTVNDKFRTLAELPKVLSGPKRVVGVSSPN